MLQNRDPLIPTRTLGEEALLKVMTSTTIESSRHCDVIGNVTIRLPLGTFLDQKPKKLGFSSPSIFDTGGDHI